YSRYVGDIFGAPLAMEALIAFFLESTFVGLWIFGWGRLPRKMHLATIWLTSFGTAVSAYFILAANSWMQHPVGYRIDHATGHAVLTNIFSVLFNSTVLLAFPHTILGALSTAGMLVVAVCGYLMLRGRHSDVVSRSMRMALPFTLVAIIATMAFGDGQGRLMVAQQPMKMAAAEAVCTTGHGQAFSIFSVAGFTTNPCPNNITSVRIPHLLSLIEDLSWNGNIKGIDQIASAERARHGAGQYVPPVGVEYWSFRLMIGAGILMFLIPLSGMLLARRRRLEHSAWFQRAALLGIGLPILGNWCGWIFTEVGRQPWVVFGLLKTSQSNSPDVGSVSILLTLGGYIVIYGVLIVIGAWLMWREVQRGPQAAAEAPAPDDGRPPAPAERPDLVLAY
ncbi:MAG TPA: cytochrome ubiquinol oxidase subunit I, partial [Dehalococcoidia bacterium]|nr:cytochrome ubiquinol oxidase subunit I [Dehalococcoidia bacterium]